MAAAGTPSSTLLAAVERARRRLWALCYRMTGSRQTADDLSQEAIARAIEREAAIADPAAVEGWLFRVATTTCLDHLRRTVRERRVTDLVDPVALPDPGGGEDPEAVAIRREDVRFAVVVALQTLPPRQRAALVLHDVCDRPLAEVAETLGTNVNALKALLHRARAAVVAARGRTDVDPTADGAVVERLARAIEARSVEAVTALLADDVWGVVDGGEMIRVATKPSYGRRAVSQRFANTQRRLGTAAIASRVQVLNGEPVVVVRLAGTELPPFATIHVETRGGLIAALRIVRAPERLTAVPEDSA